MGKVFFGVEKDILKYVCCCMFFFIQITVAAQNHSKKNSDSLFEAFTETSGGNKKTTAYYICQWKNEIPCALKVIRQLDEQTAIIILPDQNKTQFPSLKFAIANNLWKISPAAQKEITKYTVNNYIFTGRDINILLKVLQQFSSKIKIISVNNPSHSVIARCKASFLKTQLLSLNEIIFVDVQQQPQTEIGIIGYDRSFHGVNAVDYMIPGANGKNIVAGVKEQKMEATDLDLYKRILSSPIAATGVESHATIISSIIGGAGNSFYDGRGIANGCKFFPSSFANLFADDAAVLNHANVSVQNHSYGTVIQQFYGAEAVSYDAHNWQNKNFVHVFSAGNRGGAFAIDGKYANLSGYANLTGNFKMAKNIITVAAIDNKGNIAAESSAGPLYDGRIAPQITALGPNGTSDAAAAVTGLVAVLQQVHADSNNQNLPPAALLKAIMYNTADDVFNKGIDYKTGYGLLNSYACIKTLQQKKYDAGSLSQAQIFTKNITVPANAAQLKITLAYTDTAAPVNNNKAIINDLDLEVTELNTGAIFKPWVLSTVANTDSLAKPAVRKRDSLNTAEQVSIQLPAAGIYQIKITGTIVNATSLSFNVVFNIDTLNTFNFTNPQTASDVNREENDNLVIKWKTFVTDTNTTGNLYISYNNGANWQLLKSAHKIYTNKYQWVIKDTNSTAVLKMETPFGNFLSNSFIISRVTRQVVDFICADSFRLSWNKHVYASAYKIFALTDSPYLKHVATATDSFFVFNRTTFPYFVYAVEPILNNNLPAIRSLAFDVTLQGVQCFYKTIYYNLLDGNKLDIILELSIASYTDSIFFERVTPGGQLLENFGTQKTNTKTIYNQLTNALAAGTTFLRVRIKLKNGQTVYTDIIQVLTSGAKQILFYPNPVKRNAPLHYSLQQGTASDNPLQLFDISGRLVKSFAVLPANIKFTDLSAGVYIYKLLNGNKVVIETGKLVIQ
ncbi:S8 family peptidase [Ferruginibacter sp.]